MCLWKKWQCSYELQDLNFLAFYPKLSLIESGMLLWPGNQTESPFWGPPQIWRLCYEFNLMDIKISHLLWLYKESLLWIGLEPKMRPIHSVYKTIIKSLLKMILWQRFIVSSSIVIILCSCAGLCLGRNQLMHFSGQQHHWQYSKVESRLVLYVTDVAPACEGGRGVFENFIFCWNQQLKIWFNSAKFEIIF